MHKHQITRVEGCSHSYCSACVASCLQSRLDNNRQNMLQCPAQCTTNFTVAQCHVALQHDQPVRPTVASVSLMHPEWQIKISGMLCMHVANRKSVRMRFKQCCISHASWCKSKKCWSKLLRPAELCKHNPSSRCLLFQSVQYVKLVHDCFSSHLHADCDGAHQGLPAFLGVCHKVSATIHRRLLLTCYKLYSLQQLRTVGSSVNNSIVWPQRHTMIELIGQLRSEQHF